MAVRVCKGGADRIKEVRMSSSGKVITKNCPDFQQAVYLEFEASDENTP